MAKTKLKELAAKFLSGNANASEKKHLHTWYDKNINTDSQHAVEINDSEETLKQRIYLKLISNIHIAQNRRHKFGTKKLLVRLSAAAAIVILSASAWLFFNKVSVPVKEKTVHVAHGQKIQVILPDGSKVWLNSGTIFKYPEKFNGKLRTVELVEGQAFFDVKHNPDVPFIVNSSSLKINVLGTSFDVKSYNNEKTAKVNVRSGKVGVNTDTRATIFLIKDEELVLNKQNGEITKSKIHPISIASWRNNRFVFEDAPLEEIFATLARTYNIRFTFKNKKILSDQISIKLENQPLKNILEILSYTKHFKYEWIDENTIEIE